MIDYKALAGFALEAREKAYAPYSHFTVGAAVLCEDGDVYDGCNIENSSYSATICAERVALVKAISEGKRKITAIAVAGEGENYIVPCGVCLQFMTEFADGNTPIVRVKSADDYKVSTLSELLPEGFLLK